MGMLDALLKNPELIGDVAKFASENPQVAKAAMDLLGSGDGASGGGLGSILGSLESSGMGDVVSSWLGSGSNKAIDPGKLQAAIGSDQLSQFAEQAGVSGSEASTLLAGFLPSLVDKLSPDGGLPDGKNMQDVLGGVLKGLT